MFISRSRSAQRITRYVVTASYIFVLTLPMSEGFHDKTEVIDYTKIRFGTVPNLPVLI